MAGTFFFIDPAEDLFTVVHDAGPPASANTSAIMLRDLVYAAVE